MGNSFFNLFDLPASRNGSSGEFSSNSKKGFKFAIAHWQTPLLKLEGDFMQHALLILACPAPDQMTGPVGIQWRNSLEGIRLISQGSQGMTQLGEGSWQFQLKLALQAFASAVLEAVKSPCGYRVLFFDDEPAWIVTKPKSTTSPYSGNS